MPHRWVEEDARRNYLRLSAGAMLAGALVGTAVAGPSVSRWRDCHLPIWLYEQNGEEHQRRRLSTR